MSEAQSAWFVEEVFMQVSVCHPAEPLSLAWPISETAQMHKEREREREGSQQFKNAVIGMSNWTLVVERSHHSWWCVGTNSALVLPGDAHHRGAHVDAQHAGGEECPAESPLPVGSVEVKLLMASTCWLFQHGSSSAVDKKVLLEEVRTAVQTAEPACSLGLPPDVAAAQGKPCLISSAHSIEARIQYNISKAVLSTGNQTSYVLSHVNKQTFTVWWVVRVPDIFIYNTDI